MKLILFIKDQNDTMDLVADPYHEKEPIKLAFKSPRFYMLCSMSFLFVCK